MARDGDNFPGVPPYFFLPTSCASSVSCNHSKVYNDNTIFDTCNLCKNAEAKHNSW